MLPKNSALPPVRNPFSPHLPVGENGVADADGEDDEVEESEGTELLADGTTAVRQALSYNLIPDNS